MGLTETGSQITTNPMPPGERKIGSPGKAYGNQIMIGDDQFKELQAGETGEILVKGDNVMQGYFKQPEETNETILRNGWMRTGDLGYLDTDGYVFVSGRIKELIIKGGENISLSKIKNLLFEHKSVVDLYIETSQDDKIGTVIEIYIELSDSTMSAENLKDYLSKNLSKNQMPSDIIIVDKIHH